MPKVSPAAAQVNSNGAVVVVVDVVVVVVVIATQLPVSSEQMPLSTNVLSPGLHAVGQSSAVTSGPLAQPCGGPQSQQPPALGIVVVVDDVELVDVDDVEEVDEVLVDDVLDVVEVETVVGKSSGVDGGGLRIVVVLLVVVVLWVVVVFSLNM